MRPHRQQKGGTLESRQVICYRRRNSDFIHVLSGRDADQDAVGVYVVAVRAVVKVDLVEGLCCHANDPARVVPAIAVPPDDPLAQQEVSGGEP